VLQGVRQCGKTTLAREITKRYRPAAYLTLDDPSVLARAREDPLGFVNAIVGPVVLDEVQRAPELFPSIKLAVDRDRQPGRFLLTGSAQLLLLPHVADALVGRMEPTTLWPFAQQEIGGTDTDFITAAFSGGRTKAPADRPSRAQLFERVMVGGFPEAVSRTPDRRSSWFAAYVATSLDHSIRDVADIEGLTLMPRLLALIAARTGGLVNYADLARGLRLPESTVRRYVAHLEVADLVQRLPAWATNVGVRVAKSPKLHLVDSGLLAHLLGVDEARAGVQPETLGPLLETFVVNELFRQRSFSATRCDLFHFRSRSAGEVDIVLEGPGGTIVGIEVKASDSMQARDARGLATLRDEAGSRFVRGLVLYTGDNVLPLGDRLEAAPVAALWS
jgi:predicted AAA+ superfamily ATPase